MTNYEIQRQIRRIRKLEGDHEAQHAVEDELHVAVLRAIATGDYTSPMVDERIDELRYEVEFIRDLCRVALETQDIDFSRHCA